MITMITDIVFPKRNEKKFIVTAEELGLKKLCFLYSIEEFEERKEVNYETNIEVLFGIYCDEKKITKARKLSDIVIVTSTDDVRKCVEQKKPDVLFGMEQDTRKDYMHQRNSGVNHTICTLANKNRVNLGFFLSDILSASKPEVILGRMKQNIMLFQKHKSNMIIATGAKKPYQMRNMIDLAALFNVIGMRSENSKDAVRRLYEIYENNMKMKKGEFCDGVEVISQNDN